MKRAYLEELGLDKEVIDKIMAENGKDISSAKADYATIQQELEETKKQLDTASKTIEGFGDVEAIKAQVAEYKNQLEASEAEKQNIRKDYEFASKLDTVAQKSGVKQMKALKPYLDIETLKASQNQDADIEAAFKSLKENADTSFLFANDEPINNPVAGSKPSGSHGTISAVARAMGLTEKDF